MKKNLFIALLSLAIMALMSSSAWAKSDLACSLEQTANQAAGNIAALLSRGYLAAGHKYTSDGGGVDSNGHAVASEHMDLGHNMRLTHKVQSTNNGDVETYELTADYAANMTDQQIFDAMLTVSDEASKTLSKDDTAALIECDHLLGQYVGVSPQPDHP